MFFFIKFFLFKSIFFYRFIYSFNFIKENYIDDFNYFKRKNKIEINLFENNSLSLDDYEIEFLSKTNKVIDKIEKISTLKKLEILKPEVKNFNISKKKFKKKKFYKKIKKKLN